MVGPRKGGIFLSYRREETEHAAGRLADRIAERFGAAEVFMDVDSIAPGADFAEAIAEAVSGCDVLLAIIGPKWITVVGESGGRRIDDPDDFVALEVHAALTRDIPVVPVLVDGATMPKRTDLPESLGKLPNRNAVHIDAVTFRSDVGALLDSLSSIISAEPDATVGSTGSSDPTSEHPKAEEGTAGPGLSRRTVLRLAAGTAATVLVGGGATVTGLRLAHSTRSRSPSPRWVFETADQVYSSPTVVGGVVYIGSDDGSLYALDAASGRLRWRYGTSGAVTSTPAVNQGVVFVGSDDTKVHAVDAATGSGRWTYDAGAAIHSSPVATFGSVYIGCRDNNVYALDAATGHERWRFAGGDWFNSSPRVAAETVYIGCRDKNVYAIDATTGKQHWRFTTRSSVDSSPALSDGTLFIGGDDHSVYALSSHTGAWIWQFDGSKGGLDSSPLLNGGVIFIGSDDGSLYALDATTGRLRSTFNTGNGIRSTPTASGGLVYFGSRDRCLYAVDMITGTERWRFTTDGPIDDSSPVVVDGLVFIGSLDHNVYALDARTGRG